MTTATAPAAKTADPDALVRKEVARILKGPVADKMRSLIPPLANNPDAFKTVMESPELLEACLQLFKVKRDMFAEFLNDEQGNPVADDEQRVKCGRSVNEVIGMAVRQGMRSYAEVYFGDPVTPPKEGPPTPKPAGIKPPPKGWFKLVDFAKLASRFKDSFGSEKALPKAQTNSGRFYAAIKDTLDFEWQVHFFPIYVQIPSHVFVKLGVGITRMDTEERLNRLAHLALADINKAEQVIRNPMLFREMIDNNVLASSTVSEMGEAGFAQASKALDHLTPRQKWDVLANKETALKLLDDKRITKQDLEALADYLPMLNEFALDAIFDLKLSRDQMEMFMKTAEQHLGPKLFLAMFGPIQETVPDDQEEQAKLRKYQTFTQSSLRGLVSAVKQLDDNLRRTGGEGAISDCLATVCRTRRPDLEKEMKKLMPEMFS